MAVSEELKAHLLSGVSTLARAWDVTRTDGVVLGFTDHDGDLVIDGLSYKANTGLTARTLSQTTGLSVDNTEALGALSDMAIREEDIAAGRFDGARVRAWLVNWAEPAQRALLFRGEIGEISRKGGAFEAELRGLAEVLNQPQGRVYQRRCSAMLGDGACKFNLDQAGYRAEATVGEIAENRRLHFDGLGGHQPRWFEGGRLEVLDGAAQGLVGAVKVDRFEDGRRLVELWQALRAPLAAGDRVRLTAGCDKRAATCKAKFSNFLNFQGFPHIPSEDWLMSYPISGGRHDGGKRS